MEKSLTTCLSPQKSQKNNLEVVINVQHTFFFNQKHTGETDTTYVDYSLIWLNDSSKESKLIFKIIQVSFKHIKLFGENILKEEVFYRGIQ